MGSVYLGRAPGGRLAVVKVINAHLQDDHGALDRLCHEVETLGAVRNALTAALIDAEVATPPFRAGSTTAGPGAGHRPGSGPGTA